MNCAGLLREGSVKGAVAGSRQPFLAVRFSRTLGQTRRVDSRGRGRSVDLAVALACWLSASLDTADPPFRALSSALAIVICSFHRTIVLADDFVVAACPPRMGPLLCGLHERGFRRIRASRWAGTTGQFACCRTGHIQMSSTDSPVCT